jgi:DNA-binding NarL/FixJ family response regulator
LIIDDHLFFREALRRALEAECDIEVVGESNDAIEWLRKIGEPAPDVVFLDLGAQRSSNLEAALWIRTNCPNTRMIFLARQEEDDEQHALECLEAGAAGYLRKDSPTAGLISAAREVHQGRKCLSPQILGRMVDDLRLRSVPVPTRNVKLTPREREVIKVLAEGQSVRDIAQSLGLSRKTVEAHKFNLMRKLDIHSKAQLVSYAVQKKIVKLPSGAA